MNSDNAVTIQHHVRENAEDLQNYLLDLGNWEKEMEKKEKELKKTQISEDPNLPPIRNSLSRGKKKNRHKKQKDKAVASRTERIPSYDYKAWDNYDVDSELKNIDKKQSSASENSEDEDLCFKKRKQLAVLDKDKGNEYFKKGNFDQAINNYTSGMQLDPDNPLLPANRAMAFLKKQQYQAAENDCTLCLSIDPTYIKAYLRRGTARSGLKKYDLAKEDFSKVLELEPGNKQAKLELKKLKKDSRGVDAKKVSKQDSRSDEEVIKAQTFWPKFLGHKNFTDSSEEPITVTDETTSSSPEVPNKEKYENYSIISPVRKSKSERSQKPLMDIKIKDVNPISDVPEEPHKDVPMKMDVVKKNLLAETSKTVSTENSTVPSRKLAAFTLKATLPDSIECALPPMPQTSFQFLADWKKVKKNPKLAYQYLKQFPSEKLPSIFKHSMDTELFSGFLQTLSTSFLENEDDTYLYMKYLSEVGRFNTLLMFLSSSEKEALKKILDSIKATKSGDPEAVKVLKRYSAA